MNADQENLSGSRQLVTDFAPIIEGPDAVLEYPYARPDGSFVTDGEYVTPLPSDYDDFTRASDALLGASGLPLINDRIPVIAYGANVSPAKIREKMAKYGSAEMQKEMQTVPMLQVSLPDSQVVWHGRPSQAGGAFAELYSGDMSSGETAMAVVQYLTVEQVGAMHTTEGETYHFAPVTAVTIDGRQIKTYAYVAGKSHILIKDGRPVPVAIAGQGAERDIPAMTAREAVAYMLENGGQDLDERMRTPEGFVRANSEVLLPVKKARQATVASGLAQVGLSATFGFPHKSYVGRADLVSIAADRPKVGKPGENKVFVQLAEQSLERLRPKGYKEEVGHLAEILEGTVREENKRKHAENPKVKLMSEEEIKNAALKRARAKLDVMEGAAGIRMRATKEISLRTGSPVVPKGQDERVQTSPNTYTIRLRKTDG